MMNFINEAKSLCDVKDYNTAFIILKIILDSIPETAIDGSNGETSKVSGECIDVIKNIISNISKKDETLKEIFNYVIKELKAHYLGNYGIELDELVLDFINRKLFFDECEKELIMAIKDCNISNKWYSYNKSRYLNYLKELYITNNDKDKLKILVEENLDDADMLEEYIRLIKDNENIINILKDLRKKYPNGKTYISDELLDIYKDKNMKNEYKEELYDSFFIYDKFNFDKYIKIKKLYSKEEWNKELKKIIDKIKNDKDSGYKILREIYVKEEMYDDLFDLVKNVDLNRYEKYLLPKYRDEIIKIYIEHCMNYLKSANNRSAYREIAGMLKHIKELDIKKEYINGFITFIKHEYARRPALLDEISSIKIY